MAYLCLGSVPNDLHMCDVKSLLLAFNSIYVVEHYRHTHTEFALRWEKESGISSSTRERIAECSLAIMYVWFGSSLVHHFQMKYFLNPVEHSIFKQSILVFRSIIRTICSNHHKLKL